MLRFHAPRLFFEVKKTLLWMLLVDCVGLGLNAASPVSPTSLPPAVQEVIAKQVGTGKIQSILKDDEGGETSFEVQMTRADGRSLHFSVSPQGKLLLSEVSWEELPESVQKTIGSQLGTAKITKLEKNLENGEVEFQITTVSSSGKQGAFTVEADGTLSSIQVNLEELPDSVKRTISEQSGTRKIESIEKTIDGRSFEYEIEVRSTDGRSESFTVSATGVLLSVSIPFEQLSPTAQDTIKEQVGSGKILEIRKMMKGTAKGYPFEIYAVKEDKPFHFRVGPTGKFQGTLE